MGVEYELYDMDEKEYIGLGKLNLNQKGFQMPAERIAAFIADRGTPTALEFHNDCGNQPDDNDDSWKCVGRWWWGEKEYQMLKDGTMPRDGHTEESQD